MRCAAAGQVAIGVAVLRLGKANVIAVIAVSATDELDELFAASNRGSCIALAAPGVDISFLHLTTNTR